MRPGQWDDPLWQRLARQPAGTALAVAGRVGLSASAEEVLAGVAGSEQPPPPPLQLGRMMAEAAVGGRPELLAGGPVAGEGLAVAGAQGDGCGRLWTPELHWEADTAASHPHPARAVHLPCCCRRCRCFERLPPFAEASPVDEELSIGDQPHVSQRGVC